MTHRESHYNTTPEYRAWCHMKERCNNPNSSDYKYYGGRGIRVCSRWEYYEDFLKDMGRRPTTKHTLGRIDNDGNYEPNNCRWETRKQQQHNQFRTNMTMEKAKEVRWTWQHRGLTQREIGNRFGVSREVIHQIISGNSWK